MSRNVKFFTLGCKVNQYDTAAMEKALSDSGFSIVDDEKKADILIVNTCTVTQSTDRQNRQLIRQLRRKNPNATIVVTGCQAEVSSESLESMPETDIVVGNSEKMLLSSILKKRADGVPDATDAERSDESLWDAGVSGLKGHTRAFMKVQDGCRAFCSYCIVPFTRGLSRSRPLESVSRELAGMERSGIQEVVLTGIHLGLYGKDFDPPLGLVDLLQHVISESAIPRIRLSSIEPLEADDGLIRCMAENERICPHLHVPLQSGDDGILKRMNRPYTTARYRAIVERAKGAVSDLTIGCDVIVGFPGESDESFDRTRRFLEETLFTYLHVFPFSPRPGTLAFDMDGRVPQKIAKERSRLLREMSQERRSREAARYIGRERSVLIERPCKEKKGWMEGLSDNYFRIRIPGDKSLKNRIVTVRMEGIEDGVLTGYRTDGDNEC